jgi:hypothetical protein
MSADASSINSLLDDRGIHVMVRLYISCYSVVYVYHQSKKLYFVTIFILSQRQLLLPEMFY